MPAAGAASQPCFIRERNATRQPAANDRGVWTVYVLARLAAFGQDAGSDCTDAVACGRPRDPHRMATGFCDVPRRAAAQATESASSSCPMMLFIGRHCDRPMWPQSELTRAPRRMQGLPETRGIRLTGDQGRARPALRQI